MNLFLEAYKNGKLIKQLDISERPIISLGRHTYNDLCLPDPALKVSRYHTALYPEADGFYFVQDMGSQNGTVVNGEKRDHGAINVNDKIMIGDYTLIFRQKQNKVTERQPVEVVDYAADDLTDTVCVPVTTVGVELENLGSDCDGLLLLYRLQRIASRYPDRDPSLQLIAYELQKVFTPERLFIGLLAGYNREITCLAQAPDIDTPLRISRTLLDLMCESRQLIITRDAQTDEHFKIRGKTAPSVTELGLRSILCIPLIWDDAVRGILYMDSSRDVGLFAKERQKLFSLIGDDIAALLRRTATYQEVKEKNRFLIKRFAAEQLVIGVSPVIKDVLTRAAGIADLDLTMLITGEPGTGKGLLAKSIHRSSVRETEPFITVNCAAIPKDLLESELFGHEKGAFTGAIDRRVGKFELAQKGTLFLDEIGELSLEHQAKLLNVIEEKTIWPVGAKRPILLDIRIIAATNSRLEDAVRDGNFRRDLYARLNIVSLHLPPLRDRRDDIPLLAGYFLKKEREHFGRQIERFSNKSIELLMQYHWPDNIRELHTVVTRAVIFSESSIIGPDVLQLGDGTTPADATKSLASIEKEHILKVLAYTGGNKEKAARILGVAKQTLYNKGKEYGIETFEQGDVSKK